MAARLSHGGALVAVLLLLAISSAHFAQISLYKQQHYLATFRQIERYKMQFELERILDESALRAEPGQIKSRVFASPENRHAEVDYHPIDCPSKPAESSPIACVRIDAVLKSESGMELRRSRSVWTKTGCGAVWHANQ